MRYYTVLHTCLVAVFTLLLNVLSFHIPEEVGHAYGPAQNSVSRTVSKHCKWRRLSKCIFVLALLRALDPVGAPYSVRRYMRLDPTAPIYL